MEEIYSAWVHSIKLMTSNPELATSYLDTRFRFNSKIASLLSHTDPRNDCLAYGVWLEGHDDPIYIGQTTSGSRRLWDLPIGESHHLSNSFPPEVWGRVVVLYWKRYLSSLNFKSQQVVSQV
jgi:hypothetical protein